MAHKSLVLFTGGGTGGHVFPGLAVLGRIRELNDVEVAWIGGTRGVERRIVRERSVPFYGIPTGKFRRYLSLRNLWDVFRVAAGVVRSISLLRRLRPALLFSKGGFVTVPPVIAARLLGVPVVTHESDADPGLATRINARFSDAILVAYERTRRHFGPTLRSRVLVTGNPLRPEILRGRRPAGLEILGFDADDPRPIVFFLGGSLGAQQINELVRSVRRDIAGEWCVVHQTGDHGVAPSRDPAYYCAPFFGQELPDVLAAADLLVCRAGASTLWEAAALARPMLLVPLLSGSRGDQVRNAAIFASRGAAVSLLRPETLSDDVRRALHHYIAHPDEWRQMGTKAKAMIRLDATARIVDIIMTHKRDR